ncbi:hypothetical protein HDU97_010377 [Phlyctochytrium planicorne]|nr:hypothetical protein HDU97_010377 [Phlyctochytrium planicorne]
MDKVFEDLASSLETERQTRENLKEKAVVLDRTLRELNVSLSAFQSTQDDQALNNLLIKVHASFAKLRESLQELAATVPENQLFKYCGYWSQHVQQACGGASLLVFIEKGRLISLEEVEEIMGFQVDITGASSKFHITIEEYLLGVLSLAPELSRLAGNCVILGNFTKPLQIHKFLSEMYSSFQLLNLKNDNLRKRFDGLKYEVKRVEEIVYDITLRGLANK